MDFYMEGADKKVLMEVKGVTLERDGIGYFPDAPTERGIKHIRELAKAIQDGYESYIFFVIQMKDVDYFEPNDATQPEFREVLREAMHQGVKVLAYDCEVTCDTLSIRRPVKIKI